MKKNKIKVLWFTNTSSLYEFGKHSYHGGGWIDSLESLLVKKEEIELAISFFHTKDFKKSTINNTTYYPLYRKRLRNNPIKFILNNYQGNLEVEEEVLPKLLEVINDFRPDVINVFGTEGIFSAIQMYTDIPVVIHLQGLINPITDTYFPPNISKWDFFIEPTYFINLLIGTSPFFSIKKIKRQAFRERKNLLNSKFVMGRTEWDYSCTELFAPNAKYFHVDEVLRDVFYFNTIVTDKEKEFIGIVSTISPTMYKGIDTILKSAKLIKNNCNLKIRWNLVGLERDDKLLRFFENKLNVKHQEIGIECLGVLNPNELVNLLSKNDLFIHPSYIDNSPNSVCEAQILGMPVIACNVGGLSSLIEHNETGILIPSNGFVELASEIKNFSKNPLKYKSMGLNAQKKAVSRHDREKIIEDLLHVYTEILK